VQGIPVSVVDPTSGQILQYDTATRQYVPINYITAGGTISGNLTLNGVSNLAPSQSASSGSSLMTRDLSDARYGGGETSMLYMTSPVTYTNNNTLSDVPGLSASLASGYYYIDAFLGFSHTTSGGQQWALFYTGISPAGSLYVTRGAANAGWLSYSVRPYKSNAALADGWTNTGTESGAMVRGILYLQTSGTLSIRAAQSTSHANTTTLAAYSYLRVQKLQ